MASTLTQSTFRSTYKDDFTDSDNYHRILFNSGRSLQARELTQMQTIIQKEIERFGKNIFKDGAVVRPGGLTINPDYEFVKLNTSSNALPATPSDLVGYVFTGNTSNLKARIVEVVPAEGSDPDTIYVQYLGNAGALTPTIRFSSAEDLTADDAGAPVTTLTVRADGGSSDPHVGRGVKFSVGGGDFFAAGHFVQANPQSLILQKYDRTYSGNVGFIATETIVTAADDNQLYDISQDTPNTTAPGADRYKITLTLTKQEDVDSDQVFSYIARIENSTIINQNLGYDDYNRIMDVMALRTREESGDYIVKNFRLEFDPDSESTHLLASVSPGIAYVRGYRVEIPGTEKIRVPKATTTLYDSNESIIASYGNYIVSSDIKGLPNTNELEQWNLHDSVGGLGSVIGTARVKAVESFAGGSYRYYLQQIEMSGNNSFRNARSIAASSSPTQNYATLVLENNVAVIKEADKSGSIFPLPGVRPQNITDISLDYQKRLSSTADGSGVANFGNGLLGTNETYTSVSDWIVVDNSTGNVLTNIVLNSSTDVNVSGAGADANVEALAKIRKSSASSIEKTLTTTTTTAAYTTDTAGFKYINLGKADVYSLDSARLDSAQGPNILSAFVLDTGQRDNYYGLGRAVVKGGSAPTGSTGNVYTKFKYFAHGAGEFFDVNSYPDLTYGQIPTYTKANGEVINLRAALDFRPRINDAGTGYTGTGSNINYLPTNTDTINADINYYLPRYDRLTLTSRGDLVVVQGVPSRSPSYPPVPTNNMNLFDIRLRANTLNDSDVESNAIEHRGYTMKDIGRLEARINRLEEYTTLSLLEAAAETFAIVDSAGLNRTKAGFLADNFASPFFSNRSAADYRATVDVFRKVVTPLQITKGISFVYDSDQSNNTIILGDNVYLKHNSVEYNSVQVISSFENINPFQVTRGIGEITLSPTSDYWIEATYLPDIVTNQGTFINGAELNDRNRLRGRLGLPGVRWNKESWVGVPWEVGSTIQTTETDQRGRTITTTTSVSTVLSNELITEVVGDRIVQTDVIPFMRSRKVYFKATGLKPNQRFYPFFNKVAIGDYCREEPFVSIAQSGEDNIEWGDTGVTYSAHPEGSTNLISDNNGTIEGSFFIPSNESLKFRTGSRSFELFNANSSNADVSTSSAFAMFTAEGTLETRQRTVSSTRQITTTTRVVSVNVHEDDPNEPHQDPLAQSFWVGETEGVFLTKADIYFATKPNNTNETVTLEIRPVENGVPTLRVVPGSRVTLLPSEVNALITDSLGDLTEANALANPTTFVFPEPVYLNPYQDYAIVLLSDSLDYNVWISGIDEFRLGSDQLRITTQPSLGSLFKSQNGHTWSPSQNEDLAYKLYKAEFVGSGYATLLNAAVPSSTLTNNCFTTVDSSSPFILVTHPSHGFDSGDTVAFRGGLDSATAYAGILGSNILGDREVSSPDAFGYKIRAGSNAIAPGISFGNGVTASSNINYDVLYPLVQTLVVPGSSISSEARVLSGRSLAGSETRFAQLPGSNAWWPINLNANNVLTNYPLMVANKETEQTELGLNPDDKSLLLKISMTSDTTDVSPVIDMQRAGALLTSNFIDRQVFTSADSDEQDLATAVSITVFNTANDYVNETDPFRGSSASKHITQPIALEDDAVGLQIIAGAYRPPSADFLVYYRTAVKDENLADKNWVYLPEDTNNPPDNSVVFREYRYLAGGRGGTLTPFTQYQVKIVMRSSNSTLVPVIQDLRVIAMAD